MRRRVHVPLQIVGSSSSSSAPPSTVRRLMPKAEVEAKYAEKMEEILQNTFGHPQFRPSQREVMVSILSGQDTFVLMPTGAGKSLCFQLPALVLDGITVVVSPLIALMQNQVEKLLQKGISAALLCSSQKKDERDLIQRDITSKQPKTKLLYVTPELIDTQGFLNTLYSLRNNNKLAMFVVDEAHAISEWGHDFRFAYRKLSVFKERFNSTPVCALTATATNRVQTDVVNSLRLDKPLIITLSFNRPNIYYEVRFKDLLGNVHNDIASFISNRAGACGIIYCHKRETCGHVASKLKERGVNAEAYHAGLRDADRTAVQTKWMTGEVDIIVATIAFGMGIDKPDVRFVIHFDVPKNLEGFYQESGRAGRDGKSSVSLLYYSKDDKSLNSFLLAQAAQKQRERQGQQTGPQPRQNAINNSWEKMVEYCEGKPGCKRKRLLEYFGENTTRLVCGNCDYCIDREKVTKDIKAFNSTERNFASAGFAERQLNALRKKGAKSGGNEGWANEGGEEEFYDSENVFEAKQVAARGPSIDDCGSEKQFWSTLERMEQTEERKQGQKRKFGKFGHLLDQRPSSFCRASDLTDKRVKTDADHGTGFSKASALLKPAAGRGASASTRGGRPSGAAAGRGRGASTGGPVQSTLTAFTKAGSLPRGTTQTTSPSTEPSTAAPRTTKLKPFSALEEIDIV